MNYRLGIDLGTTFTAAAVCDVDTAVTTPEVVPLGAHTAAVPSVVFVADDGSFVYGDAAGRRCVTDPDQVIREFKRRIGDPVPIVVAGALYEPHVVAARFVRWVVDQVVERKGEPPEAITVTHPAAWGQHKRTLLVDALSSEDLGEVELMTEPEAAAIAYAADLKVEPGSTVAVYDLGGGTFDAAVVHGHGRGRFEIRGSPRGLASLGGADFDEAIFEHVRAQLGDSWDGLDVSDPSVLSAVAALRRECTAAKEALSSDTEATIPVMLPGIHSRVRLTRGEFEEIIAPAIAETVGALHEAVDSAGVTAEDLAAVLLVGGSSRIPLIAQRLSEELERPVVADSDPKATVALGAALSGLAERAVSGSVGVTRVHLAPVTTPAVAALPSAGDRPDESRATTRRRRTIVLAGAVVLALFAGAGTLAFEDVLPGGAGAVIGSPSADASTGSDSSTAAAARDKATKRADAEIDPWTGRPKVRTTKPGPERVGAKEASGNFDATDPGARPPVASGAGGGNGGDGNGGGNEKNKQNPPAKANNDRVSDRDEVQQPPDAKEQPTEQDPPKSENPPKRPPGSSDPGTGQNPPPGSSEPPPSGDGGSSGPAEPPASPPPSEPDTEPADGTGGGTTPQEPSGQQSPAPEPSVAATGSTQETPA